MKARSPNLEFVRPLWRGFAIAPPVTVLAYMAISLLLSVAGLIEYSGPPDEQFYITDPAVNAIVFIALTMGACVTALVWGLPLIFVLRKFRQLTSLSLILGAIILGAIVLPIELATAVVLLDGTVVDWSGVLILASAIGAAAGGVTARVFLFVVGTRDRTMTSMIVEQTE